MSATHRHNHETLTTVLFSSTLGLGATLLFWIQPLAAKSLLPITGGSPAIWHTVIVFFQTTLLLGYTYAHLLSKTFTFARQALIHSALFLASIYLLPLDRFLLETNINSTSPSTIPIQIWLGLFSTIGLPCILLSSTSPLLQAWYRHCKVSNANDPYFLYAASNVGSLSALLGFPLFLEFSLGLSLQFQIWSASFVCLSVLIFLCHRRGNKLPANEFSRSQNTPSSSAPHQTGIRFWLLYSFLGSSVMIGATTFLTTSVLNTPLMGILPLATFLATFIIAFSNRKPSICARAPQLTLLALLGVLFQTLSSATEPAWLVSSLHLSLVFFSCLYLHEQLAISRPHPTELTRFYLWISLGGVSAGLFHTFLAPTIFDYIWEYPLTVIAIGFLVTRGRYQRQRKEVQRLGWLTATTAVVLFAFFAAARSIESLASMDRFPNVIIGATLFLTYLSSQNPYRLAGLLTCLFLLSAWRGDAHGKTLFVERNFFGQSRVTMDPNGRSRRLIHGNTIHGRQSTSDAERHLPMSYYHTAGPLRRIMKQYEEVESTAQVAIVGLGAGSMLYYAQPHQTWHLFEIDPLVISLAKDSGFFSFFESPGLNTFEIHEGDARIQLSKAPNDHFDLIVLDAFSSDSIPLHLMTYEAMELYLNKLATPGLLAFHISNRTLDLAPILARFANEFELVGLSWNDPHEAPHLGKDPSHWLVLARSSAHLTKLQKDDRWNPLPPALPTRIWTDERSSILEALSRFQ